MTRFKRGMQIRARPVVRWYSKTKKVDSAMSINAKWVHTVMRLAGIYNLGYALLLTLSITDFYLVRNARDPGNNDTLHRHDGGGVCIDVIWWVPFWVIVLQAWRHEPGAWRTGWYCRY